MSPETYQPFPNTGSWIGQPLAPSNIETLSDDILLEIFMTLNDSCSLHLWHQINLVCRRWRYLAVGAPLLWTTLWTKNHELTLVMLHRSQSCELEVKLDGEILPATQDAVLAQIERIRMLSISKDPRGLRDTNVALGAIGKHAIRLRKFFIHRQRDPRYLKWPLPFPSLALMTSNLLQTLDLRSVYFDWSTLPLPNLKHLALRAPMCWTSKMSSHQIIATLAAMPLLQYLALDLMGLFRVCPLDVHSAYEVANLSQLTSLVLEQADIQQVQFILSNTTTHLLDYLSIDCQFPPLPADYEYSSLLSAVMSVVISGNFPALSLLSIRHVSFALTSQETVFSRGLRLKLPRPMGESGVVGQVTTEVITAMAPALIHLADLDIFSTFMDGNDFFRLFSRLPRLKNLTVFDSRLGQALIEELAIQADHPSRMSIPFPALKELTVYNEYTNKPRMQEFCSHLQARNALGAPLDKLHMHCALAIDDNDLETLKGLVTDLSVRFTAL